VKRTELKRKGRLSPTSKKRVRELRNRPAVRRRVFERDGGCVLSPYGPLNPDGQHWGPCLGELTPHHLRKASQGGAFTEENLRTLCATHNDMVEDFPAAAARIGLVIKSWEAK
jgi:5-methylcytosine-specific restriction endonuclease McrA